jgi:molecular chaperone GrpE (heat shock protein)
MTVTNVLAVKCMCCFLCLQEKKRKLLELGESTKAAEEVRRASGIELDEVCVQGLKNDEECSSVLASLHQARDEVLRLKADLESFKTHSTSELSDIQKQVQLRCFQK